MRKKSAKPSASDKMYFRLSENMKYDKNSYLQWVFHYKAQVSWQHRQAVCMGVSHKGPF